MKHTTAVIHQVIGPVVDVKFTGDLPAILNALTVERKGSEPLVLEVQQHIGADVIRSVAMSSTDGLFRGQPVVDTGAPITVPVGSGTLGRMLDVTGKAIDGKKEVASKHHSPIHREAPKFTDQSVKAEVFETGIKVIDLIAPFVKGGKVGLFGGAGVGKTVVITELIRNIA
ncbi:MAG: F0F1 ATP synthase subunit beta, partial [Patescibacteria group bacterium]